MKVKGKNKGGRPLVVLSDEQIKEVEELAANMTIQQIANYFGMGETTFYEIKNRVAEVAEAYKKGKSKGIKEATNLLWINMKAGDTTSIIFYLKTQAGWNEKQLVEAKDVTPQLQRFNIIARNEEHKPDNQ